MPNPALPHRPYKTELKGPIVFQALYFDTHIGPLPKIDGSPEELRSNDTYACCNADDHSNWDQPQFAILSGVTAEGGKAEGGTAEGVTAEGGTAEGGTAGGDSISCIVPMFPTMLFELKSRRDRQAFERYLKRLSPDAHIQHKDMHNANGSHLDMSKPDRLEFMTFPFVQVRFATMKDYGIVRSRFRDKHTRKPLKDVNCDGVKVTWVETYARPENYFQLFHGITACGWVQVHRYRVAKQMRSTNATIEVYCPYNRTSTSPFKALSDRLDSAPIVQASFDIETASPDGSFPHPSVPGAKVKNISLTYGPSGGPLKSANFCLHDHTMVEGSTTLYYRYRSEQALLEGFRDFMVTQGLHIASGYNIKVFDYWYMYERMRRLDPHSRFFFSSRLLLHKTFIKPGQRCPQIPGVTILDWYPLVRERLKLPTYKLDVVANHLLGKHKVDLPYAELFRILETGTKEEWGRVVEYCLQDTLLPIEISEHLKLCEELIQLGQVCNVFFDKVTSRKQMYKITSKLFHTLRATNTTLTHIDHLKTKGYCGANVLDMKKGYYTDPVSVLDFSSLYPSIDISLNLCYSTRVEPGDPRHPLGRYKDIKTDVGTFTYEQNKKGFLPQMMADLLQLRRQAKAAMKKAKVEGNATLATILDKRQLALKVVCNSIYGFTGTDPRMNELSDLRIAASITAEGRKLIHETRDYAEAKYDVECIYGDTDSVFLRLLNCLFKDAFALSEKIAADITEYLKRDHGDANILEFEKVYERLIAIQKKNYVGLAYEDAKKPPKIDKKGVASTRRSYSPFQQGLFSSMVNTILKDNDVPRAIKELEAQIEACLADDFPIDKLQLSCRLGTDYKNPQTSVAYRLADQIEEVTGDRPVPDTRIAYYVVTGKAKLLAQRVQPAEHLTKDPDKAHYIRTMEKPIMDIAKALRVEPQVKRIFTTYLPLAEAKSQGLIDITKFFTVKPKTAKTSKKRKAAVKKPKTAVKKPKTAAKKPKTAAKTSKKRPYNPFSAMFANPIKMVDEPPCKKSKKPRRRFQSTDEYHGFNALFKQ